MGARTRMLWWAAVAPSMVLSCALAVVIIGAAPPLVGGITLLCFPGVAAVLATGRLEGQAARLLGRARYLTPGESECLERVTVELVGHGFRIPNLFVARTDTRRQVAEAYGRNTVILAPRLLTWLLSGQVSREALAAVLAHAAAAGSVGPSRFDMTVRWLLLPGRAAVWLFDVTAVRCQRSVAPVALVWRIRAIFGVIAVIQCSNQHQDLFAGTVGVLVALSYVIPYASGLWRIRVQTSADAVVVGAGMGPGLAAAVAALNERGAGSTGPSSDGPVGREPCSIAGWVTGSLHVRSIGVSPGARAPSSLVRGYLAGPWGWGLGEGGLMSSRRRRHDSSGLYISVTEPVGSWA